MYKGFNLSYDSYDEKYYKIGLGLYNEHKDSIDQKIKNFENEDGTLNGSKMQADWFPTIKSDVFISHSHKNEKVAIVLAGFLWYHFEIRTFIDSCVWGCANKLLRMIDNEYSKTGVNTFSYKRSNLAASHVHMMLSVALSRMIDNTECLFFLNTPQSITPLNVIDQTVSPWIYSEIEMTRLIRVKSPEQHRKITLRKFSKLYEEGGLILKYHVDLSHLTKLNENDLNNWQRKYSSEGGFPLDILYKLKSII